jgi:hypothetical protein
LVSSLRGALVHGSAKTGKIDPGSKTGVEVVKYPKRSQYKYAKKPYKVRNWQEYEEGLRRRGDLTIWLSEEALRRWKAQTSGKPGGQQIYDNLAIETAVTVRMVYHLALRQTEGFLSSVFQLLGLNLPVPDHTTISRRGKLLGKVVFAPPKDNGPIHLLIDSTGLKIHVGHLRKPPKQRAWRKLHLAVDRQTGELLAADLTSSRARDAARVPPLLKQVDSELASTSGDGAYDTEDVYRAIASHNANRHTKVIIPPPRDARLSLEPAVYLQDRNRHIRSIGRVGKRVWIKKSGYSKRSMVENTVFRYKTIIGREMRSRTLAGQRVEARLGCRILNIMTSLGMPESCRVN